MRLVVGLLICAALVNLAFADDRSAAAGKSTPAATAAAPSTAQAAQAPSAATAPAKQAAAASDAKAAQLERDTRHFLAEGYKPETHHGEQIYCRKENVLGSRVTSMRDCGTIEQLRVREERVNENAHEGH